MEQNQGLNADEIRQMVNKTSELQGQAQEVLEQAINGKVPVFDPRSTDAVEENDSAAIVWTTKSIELAYKALRDGYSLRKSPFYRGNIDLRKGGLNFQYTEEELQEVIKCKTDIIYFANHYVKLKTENGKRQIKLRPYQEKLLKQLQNNRFNILLQSRQSAKCCSPETLVTCKFKNGEIKQLSLSELFAMNKKQSIIDKVIDKIILHLWKIVKNCD